MFRNTDSWSRSVLLGAALAGSLVVSNAYSQSSQATQTPVSPAGTPANSSRQARSVSNWLPPQVQRYYIGLWGIDALKIKYTESGEMIRFTYRVVDPAKAAALNDKKAEPFLYDEKAGVKLVVPQMEKVGKLRQSSTPIAGMSYWMAFSNVGRRVRPGDRVSVEIGNFHAMNLVVE